MLCFYLSFPFPSLFYYSYTFSKPKPKHKTVHRTRFRSQSFPSLFYYGFRRSWMMRVAVLSFFVYALCFSFFFLLLLLPL